MYKMRLRHIVSIAAFIASSSLAAQQPPAQRNTANHNVDAPKATATRVTGTLHIDGSLDEPQWKTAQPIGGLTQLDPQEGKPSTERSDIRFMYDDDALYV